MTLYLVIDDSNSEPVWSAPFSEENYTNAVLFARYNARAWILLLKTGNEYDDVIKIAQSRRELV